jgi:hypothetical protein
LIKYSLVLLICLTSFTNLEAQFHGHSITSCESGQAIHLKLIEKYPVRRLKLPDQRISCLTINSIVEKDEYKLSVAKLLNSTISLTPDSINNYHHCPAFKSYVPSILLMAGGIVTFRTDGFLNKLSVQNSVRDAFSPDFHTHVDNYFQFAPIPIVYFMDLTRLIPEHSIVHRTFLLSASELLMESIVQVLKYTTHEQRPDGSNFHSFPSGHTAEAFLAATFMHKELGKKSIWFSIGGYSCAAVVGVLRMANNRHYISDVLFSAGLGILSINAVYDLDTFCSRKHKFNNY